MWIYNTSSKGWGVGYQSAAGTTWVSHWDTEIAAMQVCAYLNGGGGRMPSLQHKVQ